MHLQQARQSAAQLGARNDGVNKPVVLEVFRGLEVVGQFFAQGLLNHAAAGEANQGFGLGQDQIAEHREAGGHATGGGVGEQGDVEQFSGPVPLQRAGDLGHLHQAQHALLHAGTTAGADHKHGQLLLGGCFD